MNDPSSPGIGGTDTPVKNSDSGDESTAVAASDQQVVASVSGADKEVDPGQMKQEQAVPVDVEKVVIEEVGETEKVPEEVEGWMERVERGEDIHLVQPVTYGGEVLVDSAQPKSTKIELPLTEEESTKGLTAKISDSVRWLAEWCVKLVKKLPGKVVYKKLT